eukprot:UC1_evm2s650
MSTKPTSLEPWVLGASSAIGLLAGLLIGAVGVGGIVLVPVLILLPNLSVQTAIASCMFAYIAAGLVGGTMYVRRKSVPWGSAMWLMIGAIPGSFAGAFILQYVDDLIVKLVLYSVILVSALFSAIQTLRDGNDRGGVGGGGGGGGGGDGTDTKSDINNGQLSEEEFVVQSRTVANNATKVNTTTSTSHPDTNTSTDIIATSVSPQNPALLEEEEEEEEGSAPSHPPTPSSPSSPLSSHAVTAGRIPSSPVRWGADTARGRALRLLIGLVVGFGSTLTGSSGPVLLLPALILLRWPVLESLGSAQVIQLPIAGAATISYVALRPGVIDWELGGCVIGGLAPGVVVGALVAHKVDAYRLKLLVCFVLVAASIALFTTLLVNEFGPK